MKLIKYNLIVDTVISMMDCLTSITPSCEKALCSALCSEDNKTAKYVLETLVQNNKIAKSKALPVCQDTGMAVFFVEIGGEVLITDGLLVDAINQGVKLGYQKNSYRLSVLDPITRENTLDNTPSIIHIDIVAGDKLKISFMPKGFGSENMSKLYMLTPAQGIDGIIDSIVDTVKCAGANPCPPILVGVGIGGTSEKAMLLAKQQLLRDVGTPSIDPTLAELEKTVLAKINQLQIGAGGFGGNTTAFAVHIAKFPTHISALPVAVNIQCNAVRLKEVVL